jgi:hypothetical protein
MLSNSNQLGLERCPGQCCRSSIGKLLRSHAFPSSPGKSLSLPFCGYPRGCLSHKASTNQLTNPWIRRLGAQRGHDPCHIRGKRSPVENEILGKPDNWFYHPQMSY